MIEVKLLDHWPKEGDEDLAHAAWASTYDHEKHNLRGPGAVTRVVRQIVEQAHDTPKEGTWLKYFIRCPIYVERQLDKYRMTVQAQGFRVEWMERPFGGNGITQNELSGRYRTMPERFLPLPHDVRRIMEEVDHYRRGEAEAAYNEVMNAAYARYEAILADMPQEWRTPAHPRNADYKRVREVLRGLLGTAYLTDMRITLNLNAFEHLMNQRLDPATQMETRAVAYLMLREAQEAKAAPVAIEQMVLTNGWVEHFPEIQKYLEENQG